MAIAPPLPGSLEGAKATVVDASLRTIDPLTDRRWDDLVANHPKASAFHQRGWLEALARTYGYKPVVLTSAQANEQLKDGIVFCEVQSWITGKRLVSLPFSDHCEPLLAETAGIAEFAEWMRREREARGWKYVELRPLCWSAAPCGPLEASDSYWFHMLDLTPPLRQIFEKLHKNSIQRRIQHAERAGLAYESGSSPELLEDFYRLLLVTRRRHQVLPQPCAWFKNLLECMGGNLKIRVARKDGAPVAAMLSLRHRTTVIYKYGCSDERFHHLAGMPFLYWKLIEESKADGAKQLDFGRSDLHNDGLAGFKDRLGATRLVTTYFRYPKAAKKSANPKDKSTANEFSPSRFLCSILPNALLPWAGSLVYRHVG